MPISSRNYNRPAAIAYAHKWSFSRNPRFLDFSELGGDCTNFMSQCLYAGGQVMNFTPTYGWYYRTSSDRTASWTATKFLYKFLTTNEGLGPYATEVDLSEMIPGDIVQLGTMDGLFYHSLFVVQTAPFPTLDTVLIATHTIDSDFRPLSTYYFEQIRFLHIEGVRK